MKLRRWIAASATALGIAAAAPVVAPAAQPSAINSPVVTKTCSGGFRHGVINGQEKCLRRGEFCARAADGQYRRYGYRCVKRDARGSYHLT
jgi:hypothetical protein